MNKTIFSLYFLLFAYVLMPLQLNAASTSPKKSDNDKHFEYSWSGTEDDLYFDLTLQEGLIFEDSYLVLSLDGEAIGCEVSCVPLKGYLITNAKGQQLKNLTIRVGLFNTDNLGEIDYVVLSTSDYQSTGKSKKTTITTELSYEGTLVNPQIDLEAECSFYFSDEDPSTGFVHFKNAFPFSEI